MDETMHELGDLTMQYVVLREGVLKGKYDDMLWRVWRAEGGFGCNPKAIGTCVISRCVRDGEVARWERYHVERLATEDEVQQAIAARMRDESQHVLTGKRCEHCGNPEFLEPGFLVKGDDGSQHFNVLHVIEHSAGCAALTEDTD